MSEQINYLSEEEILKYWPDITDPAEQARIKLAKLHIPYTSKAFEEAVNENDIVAVRLFVQAGKIVRGSLFNAVSLNHKEIAEILIRSGLRSNKALIEAAEKNLLGVVKLLVDSNVDVNYQNKGYTALMGASWKGHTEMVKLLVQKGADIDLVERSVHGYTALMYAAEIGNDDVVEVLVSSGANLNITDKSGRTALMIAKKIGHNDIVRILKNA